MLIQSVLPSVFALGLAAIVSGLLARSRWSPPEATTAKLAASRAMAVTVGVQIVHFFEEALTGFHNRLGDLLGLPAMPMPLFVVFNLTWIGIWLGSIQGVRSARTVAFFSAWFLAIAGMLNGIAHPLLAIASGGYFPGLVSSPAIAIASVWLFLRLRGATQSKRPS